jgi:hypothetical protein
MKPSRRAAWVAAVLVASPAVLAAQTRYAAGSYQYEMVTEMKQRQEVMGSATEATMRLLQRLSVAVTPRHRDTLGITFVIDSIDLDVGQPIPDSLLPDLRGMRMTGTMSPRGRLYELRTSADSLADLADDFRTFFTPLPAELAVGTTWVDTTTMEVSPAGLPLGALTMVVTSRVTADTTVDGIRAWKIERSSAGTGRGTTSQMGAAMSFEMTAAGTGITYFAKTGVYLAGSGTSESMATVTVPEHGIRLPITATGSSRVRLLPNR